MYAAWCGRRGWWRSIVFYRRTDLGAGTGSYALYSAGNGAPQSRTVADDTGAGLAWTHAGYFRLWQYRACGRWIWSSLRYACAGLGPRRLADTGKSRWFRGCSQQARAV